MRRMLLAFVFFISAIARAELPPKVVYHIGDKPNLLADAEAGTIPQDVWDKFIMGTDTRYGLVPYRRGLYGGSNFDNLELYGNLYFGTAKTPWAMKITIKDECRIEKATTSIYDDPRYVPWLAGHADQIFADAAECLNTAPELKECDVLLIGVNAVAEGKKENRCDRWMSQFLADTGAKVVKDYEWKESWYLRDRNCIENIEADPSTVLEILAKANWDFDSRVHTYPGNAGAYGGTAFALLFAALADSHAVDASVLDTIEKKTLASDITGHWYEESPATKDYWIKDYAPRLVEAYRSCSKKGKLSHFQQSAAALEKALHDPEIQKTSKFLEVAKAAVVQTEKTCSGVN